MNITCTVVHSLSYTVVHFLSYTVVHTLMMFYHSCNININKNILCYTVIYCCICKYEHSEINHIQLMKVYLYSYVLCFLKDRM